MSLYEKYKRFKAGKTKRSLPGFNIRLFQQEFNDEQLFAISDYDRINDILYSVLIVGSFLFGIMYGMIL